MGRSWTVAGRAGQNRERQNTPTSIIIIYYKRHIRSAFGFFVAAGPEVWRSLVYTWWPVAADGPAPYPRTFGWSSAAAADPLQPPRLDRWPLASATRTTECVSISDCNRCSCNGWWVAQLGVGGGEALAAAAVVAFT